MHAHYPETTGGFQSLKAPTMATILDKSDEDFDTSLDALLGESVKLSDARKAAKTGRKLSAEQSDLLEANRLAEAVNIWQDQEVYAHVTHTSCSCGNHFQVFGGWYKYQTQRRGNGRRLIRAEDHEDLPAGQYNTEATVAWCHACAPTGLPGASALDLDLLATLGREARQHTDAANVAFAEDELNTAVDELLSTLEN